MKITTIYGAALGFESGLNIVTPILYKTFKELGVEIEEINLTHLNINYYDGIKSNNIEKAFEKLKDSDGIIFATSALRLAPCALTQTFLEHIDYSIYGPVLKGKNCFCIISSYDGSEMKVGEYFELLINSLGGIFVNKVLLNEEYIKEISTNIQAKEMLEKYAEDFYRILRQGRKFFVPKVNTSVSLNKDELEYLGSESPKINFYDISTDTDLIEEKQEQPKDIYEDDINEIAQFISSKYNERENESKKDDSLMINKQKSVSDLYKTAQTNAPETIKPRLQTCKQKTQSLHHYFQPQMARDVTAIFQLNIKGKETFECYLDISNDDCNIYDGTAPKSDVIINTDSDIWLDILNAKYTTQKAFMVGRLKVKGNFVLLSKFDQMFKLN